MRYWMIDKYILTKGYMNMKDKHETELIYAYLYFYFKIMKNYFKT